MSIDISKPLVYEDGFPRVPNIIYRLYPLLDGFTVETAGFYAYLLTWRQHKPDHVMYGKAWLNLSEMEAQSGISKFKIRKHTEALVKYGLLKVTKSRQVANKKIYEFLEPLTEPEFRAHFAEQVAAFGRKLEAIESEVIADKQRLAEKMEAQKAGEPARSTILGYDNHGRPITF
jgi:hypothetical protein